jgi:hypothetical protein
MFLIGFAFLMTTLLSLWSKPALAQPEPTKMQFGLPALSRADFNTLALRQNTHLFWLEDRDNSGLIEPTELAVVGNTISLATYVLHGTFTPEFEQVYRQLVEAKRQELLREELNQGRPTLILTDLSKFSAGDKEFVRRMMEIARLIDRLYQRQKGALQYQQEIAPNDSASQAVYERNQGIWCEAPATEGNPFCNAHPKFPVRKSDAYPADLDQDAAMCAMLKALPHGKDLLAPFTVVRRQGDQFVALPLNHPEVYGPEMKQVATALRQAITCLDPTKEQALIAYLQAAAEGFETNYWENADEAWAQMNPDNSQWYLRVAPDEVYFDPCQEKAGFQLSFALVSQGSKVWKEKLNPLRDEMEQRLAKLIGSPYQARPVAFQMPEFIDIILNAGDSRDNLGAVVGESLPNWGKIAEEGRGRTVVMTNFYTDPDSITANIQKAKLFFTPNTLQSFSEDKTITLLDTLLHEATHNLGPHSDYKINDRNASQIFGGRNASILEELKAQTGGIWYLGYLVEKGLITPAQQKEAYTASIFWCFNQLSRGLFTADGNPKTYAQISAVQLGTYLRTGVLRQEPFLDPVSGREDWRFEIDFAKMPEVVAQLMAQVGQIKASGNTAAAEALIQDFVSGAGAKAIPFDEIARRYRSMAKESFSYGIKF